MEHPCDPKEYITKDHCESYRQQRAQLYEQIIAESRADRRNLWENVRQLEDDLVGKTVCEMRHENVDRMLQQWDRMKIWAVVAIVGMVVSAAMQFYAARHGDENYRAVLEMGNQVSVTNCNSLAELLRAQGKPAPTCELKGGR